MNDLFETIKQHVSPEVGLKMDHALVILEGNLIAKDFRVSRIKKSITGWSPLLSHLKKTQSGDSKTFAGIPLKESSKSNHNDNDTEKSVNKSNTHKVNSKTHTTYTQSASLTSKRRQTIGEPSRKSLEGRVSESDSTEKESNSDSESNSDGSSARGPGHDPSDPDSSDDGGSSPKKSYKQREQPKSAMETQERQAQDKLKTLNTITTRNPVCSRK